MRNCSRTYAALLASCVAVLLSSLSAPADEKKDDKGIPSGVWAKKDGEMRIQFADKDVMKLAPHGDPSMVGIVCKYTVEKDGRVKAKVTGYEGSEEVQKRIQEHVPNGFEFSFAWKVKDNEARLDDLRGKDVETLKSHLEGDFELKK
jgi:hypothetical protein